MSLIGKKISEFKTMAYRNGEFKEINNESLKGKWAAIVFYPADFTFVCPTELEDLAENYDKDVYKRQLPYLLLEPLPFQSQFLSHQCNLSV